MNYQGNQIAVPEDLSPIRDALVEYINVGGVQPIEIENLRQWIIGEGWWELSSQIDPMDADNIVCFDPSQLDTLSLSDDGVREAMGLDDDEPINNEMRFQYAIEALHSSYNGEMGGFDTWCWPMIYVGRLDRADGKSCIVGILARFQGPGDGYVPEWCDFFRDKEGLIERLKQSGYIIDTAPEDVDPQILLNSWGEEI